MESFSCVLGAEVWVISSIGIRRSLDELNWGEILESFTFITEKQMTIQELYSKWTEMADTQKTGEKALTLDLAEVEHTSPVREITAITCQILVFGEVCTPDARLSPSVLKAS